MDELRRVNLPFDGARITLQAEAGADGYVILNEFLESQQITPTQAVPSCVCFGRTGLEINVVTTEGDSENEGHIAGHRATAELVPGILVLPGRELSARHGAETQQSE
ncbi:MAG: hypothetical protein WAT74_10355 [Flavobacteriales bacterium]